MHQDFHLRRVNQRLAALSSVNHAILTTRDNKQHLLLEACRIIRRELGYSFVWLAELVADEEITTQVYDGAINGSFQETTTDSDFAARIARKSAETQACIVEALAASPSLDPTAALSVAALCAPLSYSDILNPMLVLVIAATSPQHTDAGELQILQELLSDLGLAVDAIAIEARSRHAEEALRISEDRFRRLAEHSLVGIVLIQNDLYRYVNPAFARMFGYETPGQIIDHLGPVDLAAPKSRAVVAENVSKRVLGQVRAVRYQYRGLRKDGTAFDVEEYGARTIHAQRLAIVATVIDISAREASRRRLEALSRAGLALARAQTPYQALNIAVEQVAEILHGAVATIVLRDREEFFVAAKSDAGKSSETVHAPMLPGAPITDPDLLQRILATREPVVVDLYHAVESGGMPSASAAAVGAPAANAHSQIGVPLIVRGEIIGILIAEATPPHSLVSEDAQHLRLFADQVAATYQHLHLISHLEEERNRLRILNKLSHTLSETLLLQEVAERAIQETSRALQADVSLLYLWDAGTATLTAAAANGLPADTLPKLNAQLHAGALEPWTAAIVSPGETAASNTMDGSPHWEYADGLTQDKTCTLTQRLEARGELMGLLSFSRRLPRTFSESDITLVSTLSVPVALAIQNARLYEWISHQAEVMSDALHRQEELDQMKDELIQNISHELRTPLALVMGYAEMLDTGQLGPIAERQASAISVIARRSRMLRSLVEDIALLWNIERKGQTLEILDLREAVETALDEFNSQAQARNLELRGAWPAQSVAVAGVPVHIRRVLDNLIGNALKFTQPGGQIQVRLRVEEDYAVLSVSDSGIGVPKDKLDRIFERFYQVDGSAKRRYGGTGLGLALVKAIIDAHHGTIQAVSPISEIAERPGTEVVVRLPLASELDKTAEPG